VTTHISPEEAKKAQAGGYAPAGRHLCECVEDTEKKSQKAPHSPYINARFVVVGGEHDGMTKCWDVLMLGGKGMGIGVTKLEALGYDFSKPFRYNSGDLSGRRVYITTVEQEYEKPDGKGGTVKATKMVPIFDRDLNFGYEPVDGVKPADAEAKMNDCTCGHKFLNHPAATQGKCTMSGCGCAEFNELPF
jgi:hypothetical protein